MLAACGSAVSPRGSPSSYTWLRHASGLLLLGAQDVLIDPIFSGRVSPVQWLGPCGYLPVGIHWGVFALASEAVYAPLDDLPTARRQLGVSEQAFRLLPLGGTLRLP